MASLSIRLVLAAVVGLAGAAPAMAMVAPMPPCGDPAVPAPAPPGAAPVLRLWSPADLGADWQPPPCTGWARPGFRTLLSLSGRFVLPGGADAVLARFGAVSGYVGTRYWSTSGQRWMTLIIAAHALAGPRATQARPDFSAAELAAGGTFFLSQTDNDSGPTVYRMRVLVATPKRVVIEVENASTIRLLLFPMFSPGDIQSLYVLQAEADDVWVFYELSRTATTASVFTKGHEASFVNRAVAFYRHIVGIPTDQEPPPVR
jgi:hypothetical protein